MSISWCIVLSPMACAHGGIPYSFITGIDYKLPGFLAGFVKISYGMSEDF